MKILILYISFTPFPPFLWELTGDIFLYLILILYFISNVILKYYPIFKNYFRIFVTLQMLL